MNDEAVYRTAPATPGLLITGGGDQMALPFNLNAKNNQNDGFFLRIIN